MIDEKVKKMIRSNDPEMVRLGAIALLETISSYADYEELLQVAPAGTVPTHLKKQIRTKAIISYATPEQLEKRRIERRLPTKARHKSHRRSGSKGKK
jgi:hypothetical protein